MRSATWLDRWFLPGFAFKAVVIGGGYATGRELAEFFLPSGPRGGLCGMLLACVLWSAICVATFEFARRHAAFDYRRFFGLLLGRGWWLFELAYDTFLVLILAVFGAAAGEIGTALFAWPPLAGTCALMIGIAGVVAYGNRAVERVFKWVTLLLYAVYALLLLLSFAKFGARIAASVALPAPPDARWALDGATYAGYNVVGAVVILPALRHLVRRRDAIVAGVLAGPIAMLPALLFFACMAAFYPEIGAQTLPSDFLLRQLDAPWFHLLFQAMIFAALLESGSGALHALIERIAAQRTSQSSPWGARPRLAIAALLLIGSIGVAQRVGLVALIAKGYRALAAMFLAVYVLPLLLRGLRSALRGGARNTLPAAAATNATPADAEIGSAPQ